MFSWVLVLRQQKDTLPIEVFSKDGNSKSWTITHGREVALILVGLYYVERGRVV